MYQLHSKMSPQHMTDSELEKAYSSYSDNTVPEANQILIEMLKRGIK